MENKKYPIYFKGTFEPRGRENVRIDVHTTNQYKELVIGEVKVCIIPTAIQLQINIVEN